MIPNTAAMRPRSDGERRPEELPIRAGRRRRTRTNTTIVMVSTSTWVSARSGAPWSAKNATIM